jgi:hypothetical protein
VTCWDPETFESYQLKGRALIDVGRYYEVFADDFRGKPWIPRVAVVVEVEEVYTVKPGEYGRRVS